MQNALPLDGFCCGPLFAPPEKRRPSLRAMRNESGGAEVWRKYSRALPPWATHAQCNQFWVLSQRVTAETGVQQSVDHIVPLQHPLVCGLHCPANLRVLPLVDNLRKSNNHWPDQWASQGELFCESNS